MSTSRTHLLDSFMAANSPVISSSSGLCAATAASALFPTIFMLPSCLLHFAATASTVSFVFVLRGCCGVIFVLLCGCCGVIIASDLARCGVFSLLFCYIHLLRLLHLQFLFFSGFRGDFPSTALPHFLIHLLCTSILHVTQGPGIFHSSFSAQTDGILILTVSDGDWLVIHQCS